MSPTTTTPVGDFGAMALNARSAAPVAGIAGSGAVAFELAADDNDTARFASREAAASATRPQLVLTVTKG